VVRSRPRLCLAQAFWALISIRLEAVEPLVADAERGFAAVAEEPYEPSVGRATSLVANVPAAIGTLRAGLARMQGDAERATRPKLRRFPGLILCLSRGDPSDLAQNVDTRILATGRPDVRESRHDTQGWRDARGDLP
jgi:hypothetical protein